jgi:hypothetical protein
LICHGASTVENPDHGILALWLSHCTLTYRTFNLSKIAELSEGADKEHVAAHIRGMVGATMGHLSVDAPAITRNNA